MAGYARICWSGQAEQSENTALDAMMMASQGASDLLRYVVGGWVLRGFRVFLTFWAGRSVLRVVAGAGSPRARITERNEEATVSLRARRRFMVMYGKRPTEAAGRTLIDYLGVFGRFVWQGLVVEVDAGSVRRYEQAMLSSPHWGEAPPIGVR